MRPPKTRECNLCLAGLGNVGRALVRLLDRKRGELRQRYGLEWKITGLATRRRGWIAYPEGFDPAALGNGGPWPASSSALGNVREWLRAAGADVLFEATPLDLETGQPAIDHIRAALQSGAHAITANKGPVAHAYAELSALAARAGRRFLFESAVMDGAPVFSLFRECLPAIEVRRIRGILNSTTNVVLEMMEDGHSLEAAVRAAQEQGIAEADPRHDLDGWDAAVKLAALAIVIFGCPLPVNEVRRQGIGDLTAEKLRAARASGQICKLVCRAERRGRALLASVIPELLPLDDPLARVQGTSSAVYFETDVLPGLGIVEIDPTPEATAYGMLSDFIRAVQGP